MNSNFIISLFGLIILSLNSKPNLKREYIYEYTISNSEIKFSSDLLYDKNNLTSMIVYDEIGGKVKEEKYEKSQIKSIDYFEYVNNKLVEIIADTSYNFYRTHEFITYPSSDKLCRAEYSNEKLKRTFCPERNANGKLVESTLINSKSESIHTTSISYDLHGREITRIEYDRNKKMTFGYYSAYSSLDTFCTSHVLFDRKGEKFISLELLKYDVDETANSISTELLYFRPKTDFVDTVKIRTYKNDQDRLIKRYHKPPIHKGQDNEWKITEYKYEYY